MAVSDIAQSAILADIRTILNEPVANMFTDTELNELIDQSARSICILGLANHTTEEVTILTSKFNYNLTNHYVKVESAVYDNSDIGMQRIHPRMIGHIVDSTVGVPRYYFTFGNDPDNADNLFIWPTPHSDQNSHKIEVFGYGIVDDYETGTGTVNLVAAVQPYVVDYTLANSYPKLGKHNLSRFYWQKYLSEVFAYRQRTGFLPVGVTDSKDTMKLPDNTVVVQ